MRSVRIALRTLARRPSFTAVAVLTLALGLGATAALFTVVNAVLLEPLPYTEPGRLVRVVHPVPGLDPEWRWGLSEAGWYALRDGSESLSEIGVYELPTFGLAGEGVAERVRAARVSASLFEVLRARPALGRLFRESDQEPGGPLLVVLGHDFWRTRFDADPGVVGSTVRIEGNAAEVVGVLESGFDLPDTHADVWVPAWVSRENRPVNWHRFHAIGRLANGASMASARSDLRAIVRRFPEQLPTAYGGDFMETSGFTVDLVELRDHVVGDVAGSLWVLLAAVGLVLLIGCANVANLFLVRLEGNRREWAVRGALGASWRDLVRHSLSESVVIAVVAAALGLLLGWWGLELLIRLGWGLPRLDEIEVGRTTVGFTVAVAGVIAVVFGLLPALRPKVSMRTLREGTGLTASRHGRVLRSGLVIGEIALALVVLAGAGLMLRTFQNLRAVDPGLDPEGVLTMQVMLPTATYPDFEAVASFYRTLTERVGAVPGVAVAGATQQLPLAGVAGCSGIAAEDPEAETTGCFASTIQVTPGYFAAMGIPVEGEAPGWESMMARRGGVVVSRPLAEHVWEGDPMGRGIRGNGRTPPYYRVVGIAGPVRHDGLGEPPVARVYFPMLPVEGAPLWAPPRQMTLVVRSAGPRAESLAGPVRGILAELDPLVAIGEVRTMEAVVARSTAATEFVMLLLAIAASVALALGVIGLYGVVAYSVEQRRSEIGIRMALGARSGLVLRGIVSEAAGLVTVGLVAGGLTAVASTRVLASQLFGVTPGDPATLAGAAALLAVVGLAAAFVPARRAARVNPMRVLRGE